MSTRAERKYVYGTNRWLKLREAVLDKHGGLCVRCQKKGYIEEAKIVHHIKPWKEGKTRAERHKLIWDKDNLEPVCHDCHNELHHDITRDKRISVDIEKMALKMLGLDDDKQD